MAGGVPLTTNETEPAITTDDKQKQNNSPDATEKKPDPLNMPDKKVLDYTYVW